MWWQYLFNEYIYERMVRGGGWRSNREGCKAVFSGTTRTKKINACPAPHNEFEEIEPPNGPEIYHEIVKIKKLLRQPIFV